MSARSAFRAIRVAPVFAALLLAAPAQAPAGPALAFDAATGEVLHAYEPFRRWYPASLTKLMTVYVVFAAIEAGRVTLETPVRISERAAAETVNTLKFPVGAEIPLEEALRILMVKSANDVAVAVAETVAGSLDAFVAEMNATAARLGMTDSAFVNPHGLHDPRHVTTARDLAILARALIRDFPQHQGVFGVERIEVGREEFRNPNRLLGRFPGADGMKTGYLCVSGWNMAASATRDGRRLVAIVLGALREGQREEVAAELLEAGFDAPDGAAAPAPGRATLDDLSPPAATSEPVDMRPYTCEKKTPPADIASFGIEGGTGTATPSEAPKPQPRPAG
jgi:D-alanyl-D-alanine carboxypeptidase